VLIALPKNAEPDAVGSALALAAFIKKLGSTVNGSSPTAEKTVDVVCEQGDFSQLGFLPGTAEIKNITKLPGTFTITIDTRTVHVDEISYTSPTPDALEIEIVPKGGSFTAKDVTLSEHATAYDLIITVDTPSLGMLGELYAQNAEVFFRAVKVNVDSHIANENFGDVNLVDIVAASTAEVVYELIRGYGHDAVDEGIATALLAGIISKTNSFQNSATTPGSFQRASELVQLGARQQEIIRALFKTRQFSMMKLWGRAMARTKVMPELGVAYSAVNAQDVERSGASDADVLAVAREFSRNADGIGDAKLVFLFVERDGVGMEAYISANQNVKLADVVAYFGGELVSAGLAHAKLVDVHTVDIEHLLGEMHAKLKGTIGL
jgi:phosphoesterase RecJ-like protein